MSLQLEHYMDLDAPRFVCSEIGKLENDEKSSGGS
jgi:hypothetical protein